MHTQNSTTCLQSPDATTATASAPATTMLRYRRLLLRTLDPDGPRPVKLRELARNLNMPVPSLHNYVQMDVLPRIENISKMAEFYNESISSLFSADDDTTATLVAAVRKLSADQKAKLLPHLLAQLNPKAHPKAHP